MASEYYKCKEELSITYREKGENEQIAIGTFGAFHDILVKKDVPEIKPFSKYGNEQSGNQHGAVHILEGKIVEEDPTKTKPFNEYVMFNYFPEQNEKKIFYDPHPSEFEVTRRNSVEDPKESKFSPTHSFENMVCILAGELAKPQISHYNKGVTIKNEDEYHSKCSEDLSSNNAESETIKTECDIDIIYEDIKPQICEENSSEKNENESYLNSITDIYADIGTEIAPNFSIDSKTRLQQNIVYGTALERANNTRKESTMRINSINSQMNPKVDEKKHLTEHERVHTGEKQFKCIICSIPFSRKGNLMRHEKIHTGDKLFQCKICSKSFSQKGNLTDHEIVHSGEKQFKCIICSIPYSRKGDLIRHEKIHTGEKPFQCKICSKSFSQKGDLTEHERGHTGGKQFKCINCSVLFSRKGDLVRHEKIHTREKQFQCKICSKSFFQKENLSEHERSYGRKTI